jgi:hypothetical protein
MKATFVETTGFTGSIVDLLPDHAYARLQQALMKNPDAGAVMPGCGGLRKVRSADPKRGKGKRGGVRVIYLHVPGARRFYMLDLYGKNEKEDLSSAEKKELRHLAEVLKREALAAHERWVKESDNGGKNS